MIIQEKKIQIKKFVQGDSKKPAEDDNSGKAAKSDKELNVCIKHLYKMILKTSRR